MGILCREPQGQLAQGALHGLSARPTMGTPQRNKVLVGICRNQQGRNSPSGLRRSETELNAKEPFLEISAHVRSVKHCCTRTAEDFALFLNKISVFIFLSVTMLAPDPPQTLLKNIVHPIL